MNLTIEDENEGQASLSCVLSCFTVAFLRVLLCCIMKKRDCRKIPFDWG